jgi:hypothetical protein
MAGRHPGGRNVNDGIVDTRQESHCVETRPLSSTEEESVSQGTSCSRRYRYSASLEFDDAAPETVRGEVAVRQVHLAAKAALVALKKAHPGRRPSSLVIVLEMPSASCIPHTLNEEA